jgi:uncharacterized membrane protein
MSSEHSAGAFSKHRLEALSDGVFAIAMTLLVLDLHVPKDLAAGGLAEALKHESHAFLSFALTFAITALFWARQHRVFDLIESTGAEALVPTFALLGFVSLLPFTTSLIGAPHPESLSFVLYFSNQFAIAASLTVKLELARWKGRLHQGANADHVRLRLYILCFLMLSEVLAALFFPARYVFLPLIVFGGSLRIFQGWIKLRKQHDH